MTDTSQLKYAKSHEWARQEGGAVVVGITDFAQREIRDIVYVELPKSGRAVKQSEPVCTIESVKAAFEVYAPVSGKVVAVNEKIPQDVAIVHRDPYNEGWLFKIEASNPSEMDALWDEAQYNKHTADGGH